MSNNEPDENDDVAEPVFPGSGPNREEMISDYLPDKEDWEAKTILDLSDPAAVAALSNLDEMFPEVDDLQPLVDDFLHHYLKSRTSVGGESRDDFRSMFQAMYGSSGDEDGKSRALQLVAADD